MLDGPEGGAVANLSGARGRASQAFDDLAVCLRDANQELSGLEGVISRLRALLGGFDSTETDGANLRDACETIAELLGVLAEQMADRKFDSALTEALAAIDGIRREARQLTVVSTMTRITAESLGVEQVNSFVDSLRSMTQKLSEGGGKLAHGIRAIDAAQGAACGALRGAASRAAQVRGTTEGAQGKRAQLQSRHESLVKALSNLEQRLVATGRQETGTLVAGIQFADELAQRLEHVQAILEDKSAAPAACAHLGAAQLAAMVGDAEAVRERLRQALAQLRDGGRQAAETLAADLGGEVEALLMALGDELEESAQLDETLGPVIAVALDATRSIRERVSLAYDSFRRLSGIEQQITLAAVNAGLLASHWESAKAALSVLSRNVQESSQACSDRTAACRSALARIDTALDATRLPELEASAGRLTELVLHGRKRHAAVVEGFQGLSSQQAEASAAAGALSDKVAAALQAMDNLPGVIAELRKTGDMLAAQPAPNAAQLETLVHLPRLYTMQRERDVHASFCGQSTDESTVNAEQSLDDIFF